ncbi:MAG: LamG domain-containing protein [Gemmatimonadetes bacterium]|jgi:hypothetical protein|nr:LamG domain-containing protein [Gemmatimonadota bacterium]
MELQTRIWTLDNLEQIDDRELTLIGAPEIVASPQGPAVEFNGTDDGIELDVNPLIDLAEFTVEVIFRPDADGLPEQRFLHMGEPNSDRLLFETRLTDDGHWYLDTFISSGVSNRTLLNKGFLHPVGEWYHLAVTCDGKEQVNFVDGQKEQAGPIDYTPATTGRTSIGVRLNRVCWFKGAIHKVQITPTVLPPADFTR